MGTSRPSINQDTFEGLFGDVRRFEVTFLDWRQRETLIELPPT